MIRVGGPPFPCDIPILTSDIFVKWILNFLPILNCPCRRRGVKTTQFPLLSRSPSLKRSFSAIYTHIQPTWALGNPLCLPCFDFKNSKLSSASRRLWISANNCHRFSGIDFPLIEHRNKEYRRMEVQGGSHTTYSNAVRVARTHMQDWLILILLVVMEPVLNHIHPFYRFVGKDMMTDLKYPLKSDTVPFWAVLLYAVALPLLIFLVVYYRRRDVYDLHHSVLGLLYSVLVTAVVTDSIKIAVGRPRPDFFWLCFPDGKDVYDELGNVICHGDVKIINEGHKSFPSGHTSLSFAGMMFLSLYLSGKLNAFDRGGHVGKLCIIILPLLVAAFVGISRVDDYRHHWQDVFVGGLLGVTAATFCYLQFFPPPYHPDGWGPYAYFWALKALPTTGPQVGNAQDEGTSNAVTGFQSASNTDSRMEDLESGKP